MASVGADLRTLASCLLVCVLLGLGACSHPCLNLAEKLCECETNEVEKDNCKRRMKSAFDQTMQDDLAESAVTCRELMDACDCQTVATEEGKRACGLSR